MSIISSRTFWGLSLALMTAALCLIFLYAPADTETGLIQKILYMHVPVSWIAFLAFFVVFACSILFLWRRDSKWDDLACSSAELGLVFTTLALLTGSIWAKSAWGVWWTWDARLTSTLVLWFIYLAYFTIRASVSDEEKGSRLAAVTGIVGFVDLPICFLAIVLWRTAHPEPLIFQGGLAPPMLIALLLSLAAFSCLYLLLLGLRIRLKASEREIRRLKCKI